MASVNLAGTLKDSLGEVDVGAIITFTHKSTTGETLATTKVDLVIPPDGSYNIDLEYGRIRVDYRTRITDRFLADVIVDGTTTATTIPQLLNAAVPVKDDVIIELESIAGDAIAAKTAAEAAEVGAVAAQTAVEDSAEKIELIPAMTSAEFHALAEKRRRDSAGSGFAEWGLGHVVNNVSSGMWTIESVSDKFYLGASGVSSGWLGSSRTKYPIANINGIRQRIALANYPSGDSLSYIDLPPAPDGTKTYDSATGTVTAHASAAEAFLYAEPLTGNGWDGASGSTPPTGWTFSSTGVFTDNGSTLTFDRNNAIGVNLETVISTEVGASYVWTMPVISNSISGGNVYVSESGGASNVSIDTEMSSLTFTATATTTTIGFRPSTSATQIIEVGLAKVVKKDVSVITSRQDFAFIESWHEKISDKDVIYPLGNVQYGATSWEGITLSNSLVAQGYSAFGEWDSSTTGHGVTWSTLTEAQKNLFINDPENNIYAEDGELIQVRYRIRVIEGLGDEWEQKDDNEKNAVILAYKYSNSIVGVQGDQTTAKGLGQWVSGHDGFTRSDIGVISNKGALSGYTSSAGLTTFAHNGLCFAVPIALVQRRNQGAYHPYNPDGTGKRRIPTGYYYTWFEAHSHLTSINSISDCFDANANNGGGNVSYGNIVLTHTGRPDGKFYDAIYASDIKDLRMSSKRLPIAEIRQKYKRMAIAGDVRGFEAVPFTRAILTTSTGASTPGSNYGLVVGDTSGMTVGDLGYYPSFDGLTYQRVVIIQINSTGTIATVAGVYGDITRGANGYFIHETTQTHKSANPAWTDIIGDPANIASLCAAQGWDGIEGQWIPVIPDGTGKTFPLNRKSLVNSTTAEFSVDNGDTWSSGGTTINPLTNSLENIPWGGDLVALQHYETQAHFTEDANNSEVVSFNNTYFGTKSSEISEGNLLLSSLIGKIGTYNGVYNTSMGYGVYDYFIKDSGEFSTEADDTMQHDFVAFQGGNTPTIKVVDYLTDKDGVAALNFIYNEILDDNNDSGDFVITSGQGIAQDDNGDNIIVGTASFNTQFFIVEE